MRAALNSGSSIFNPKFVLVLDFSLSTKFDNIISNTDNSQRGFFGWPRQYVYIGGWTQFYSAIG